MSTIDKLKNELAATIRLYHNRGWSPATSTNYSFLDDNNTIWVSRSGVDKSQFSADDFITVNTAGKPIGAYAGVKPSAETLIHCILYQLFPNTRVILHSHSVFPVLMSMNFDKE
ncbi:MAG TPA: class II aldolase/adducin family protein, partial [Taishania sp.]|nr:class II aldolase/adducin family protein [Taishania sp.]